MSLFDAFSKELNAAFPSLAKDEDKLRTMVKAFEARAGAIGNVRIGQEQDATAPQGTPDFQSGDPFTEINLDLADPDLLSPTGKTINFGGHELYFRREGSSPAARLQVTAGGNITNLFPGALLQADFKSLTFKLNQGDVTVPGYAFARLIITNVKGASYRESAAQIAGKPFGPFPIGDGNLGVGPFAYGAFPSKGGMGWVKTTGLRSLAVGFDISAKLPDGTVTVEQLQAIAPRGGGSALASPGFLGPMLVGKQTLTYDATTDTGVSLCPLAVLTFDVSGGPDGSPFGFNNLDGPNVAIGPVDTYFSLRLSAAGGTQTQWQLARLTGGQLANDTYVVALS